MRRSLAAVALAGVAVVTVVACADARGAEQGDPKALVAAPSTPRERAAPGTPLDTAFFAGGCFWGVEAVFEHTRGVDDVVSGYAGGALRDPNYEQVGSGRTGHAESVRVVYDPATVSYKTLLKVFFTVAHDPTEKDRQGPDVGTQYRSAIFYKSEGQRADAQAAIDSLTAAKAYKRPIVTEVSRLTGFYAAEDYHQDYLMAHPTQPYIQYNDLPKLAQLRARYPELWVGRMP
jgi:peptide-methionine (S)-S-oxide reductase